MRHLITFWFYFITAVAFAQTTTDVPLSIASDSLDPSYGEYTLTVYVIPSVVKYDWSSPHTLYHTYKMNYIRNLFRKDHYILGHAFLELHAPGSGNNILTGMRADGREEQRDLVMRQDYGLAILGMGLEGRLEIKDVLHDKVDKYSKKGDLAFIQFLIRGETYDRLVDYLGAYKARLDSLGNPGPWYGGVFYPRYYGEGAGCSAFVVSFMDLSGILRDSFDSWKIDVNIPMDLIGGPFNDNHDVRLRDIRRCHAWDGNSGVAGVDYEPFEIFDPTLIYEWVVDKYENPVLDGSLKAEPMKLNKSLGIKIDARDIPLPKEDIFLTRDKPSIFVEHFKSTKGAGK